MRIDIELMKERGFEISVEDDAIYIGPRRYDEKFHRDLLALCRRAGLTELDAGEVVETISDLQIIRAIRS